MNQDDLKAVYFGYFDQLPEPWATQAKDAFSKRHESFYEAPASLSDALDATPLWNVSDEQNALWNSIYSAIEQGWNYLPVLPTDTDNVYEVACFAEDGSEWIELCTFDDSLGREAAQAHNLFARSTQNVTLNGLDLTPYAWRPVPPATIPPRPQ